MPLIRTLPPAQESAGSYAYLRDVACLKVESPRPLDLTPEAASMLEKLMLGQAQVRWGDDGMQMGRAGRPLPQQESGVR